MYWWHLVNQDKNTLISKFYNAQKNIPVKGDWTNQIDTDKANLNIQMKDEDLLNISKKSFKHLIRDKINKLALKELNLLKVKHSKLDNLNYQELCKV